MAKDPTNSERIAFLEKELETARKTGQKYIQDLEKLRQQYADDLFEDLVAQGKVERIETLFRSLGFRERKTVEEPGVVRVTLRLRAP